jgi:hypothetical protein
MRAWPHQICLRALSGETTLHGRPLPSKAEAAAWLKDLYGQDFGEDFTQWKAWLRYNWQKGRKPCDRSRAKPELRRPPR